MRDFAFTFYQKKVDRKHMCWSTSSIYNVDNKSQNNEQ